LTIRLNISIIEILQDRTNFPRCLVLGQPPTLERQSGQLLGYLDAWFQRWMLAPRAADDPVPECSREGIRTLILLRSPQRMSALAQALGVPLSTATHTVDRLVAQGLAIRVRSEKDRRVVQVEMSPYGKRLQESFRNKRRAMARSWLAPLSPEERVTFLELMGKITRLAQPASGNDAGVYQPRRRPDDSRPQPG
jgi:DNA-binding MarR family transcriptional regulator